MRAPLSEAKRATVHRALVRHQVSRLSQLRQAQKMDPDEGALKNTLKEYGPGFVHRDCFVAIDRATRLSHLAIYESKDAASATDFLRRCLAFFPFKISKLLTDNGRVFTLKGFRNHWGNRVHTKHTLSALYGAWGIEHRATKPYTPKTNGMAERMN